VIEKFFVEQGIRKVELDRYLAKELEKAGFTKSEIVKTPLVTRIVVNVTRPGLAIGKSGSNISQLTETIHKRFKIDNPQLEIKEIENQNLDAKAVANRMKATIERGFSWRSVLFKTMNDIRFAGALGIEIIVSGKITGKAGRKRKQRYFYGYIKKVGEQARLVDYAKATAYPKVGAIGIKIRIIRPETRFPDKIKIQDYIKKPEVPETVVAVEETKTEDKAANGTVTTTETKVTVEVTEPPKAQEAKAEAAAEDNKEAKERKHKAKKEKPEAKEEPAQKAEAKKEEADQKAEEKK